MNLVTHKNVKNASQAEAKTTQAKYQKRGPVKSANHKLLRIMGKFTISTPLVDPTECSVTPCATFPNQNGIIATFPLVNTQKYVLFH